MDILIVLLKFWFISVPLLVSLCVFFAWVYLNEEDDQRKEFKKWLLIVLTGEGIIWILALMSPAYQPAEDPNGFVRSMIWKHAQVVLAVIGICGGALAINWITKHDWWDKLTEGQYSEIAVGLAAMGLFLAIGIAVSGAM